MRDISISKIMTEFATLRPKMMMMIMIKIKEKGTKKEVIIRKLRYEPPRKK